MIEYEKLKTTILAFEGPDKSGKSTLIREINKATNYKFLCIDRFIASAWVYDRLTDRRNRTEELSSIEQELNQLKKLRVMNILLKCDPNKLRARIKEKDEYCDLSIQQVQRLDEVIALYDVYVQRISRLSTIAVDTSNKTVEETVVEILERVTEYEQNNN